MRLLIATTHERMKAGHRCKRFYPKFIIIRSMQKHHTVSPLAYESLSSGFDAVPAMPDSTSRVWERS